MRRNWITDERPDPPYLFGEDFVQVEIVRYDYSRMDEPQFGLGSVIGEKRNDCKSPKMEQNAQSVTPPA